MEQNNSNDQHATLEIDEGLDSTFNSFMNIYTELLTLDVKLEKTFLEEEVFYDDISLAEEYDPNDSEVEGFKSPRTVGFWTNLSVDDNLLSSSIDKYEKDLKDIIHSEVESHKSNLNNCFKYEKQLLDSKIEDELKKLELFNLYKKSKIKKEKDYYISHIKNINEKIDKFGLMISDQKKLEQSISKLVEDRSEFSVNHMIQEIKNCFKIKSYQHNYIDSPFNSDSPSILRYALDIRSLDFLINTNIYKSKLHFLEEVLFERAISTLKKVDGYDEYNDRSLYPKNVVLVDTLVRRSESKIKHQGKELEICKVASSKISEVEIHTVLIWKTSKTNYNLIDPSKKSFTENITKALNKYFNNHISFTDAYPDNINDAFYVNGEEKNPNNKEAFKEGSRNCIDVSAKMGFEILELQKYEETGDDNLNPVLNILNKMSYNLSNQYEEIPDQFKGYIYKDVLSSNKETRKNARKIMSFIFENFKHKLDKKDPIYSLKSIVE